MKIVTSFKQATFVFKKFGFSGLYCAIIDRIRRKHNSIRTNETKKNEEIIGIVDDANHRYVRGNSQNNSVRFTIVVIDDGKRNNELTIQSINQVDYDNYDVVWLSKINANIDTIKVPSYLILIPYGYEWQETLYNSLEKINGDYLILLSSGEIVSRDCFKLAAHEVQESLATYVYSDFLYKQRDSRIIATPSLWGKYKYHSSIFEKRLLVSQKEALLSKNIALDELTEKIALLSYIRRLKVVYHPGSFINGMVDITSLEQNQFNSEFGCYRNKIQTLKEELGDEFFFLLETDKNLLSVSIILFVQQDIEPNYDAINALLHNNGVDKPLIYIIAPESLQNIGKSIDAEIQNIYFYGKESFIHVLKATIKSIDSVYTAIISDRIVKIEADWLKKELMLLNFTQADAVSPLVINHSGIMTESEFPLLELDCDKIYGDNKYAVAYTEYYNGIIGDSRTLSYDNMIVRTTSLYEFCETDFPGENIDYYHQEICLYLIRNQKQIILDGTNTMVVSGGVDKLEPRRAYRMFWQQFVHEMYAQGLCTRGVHRYLIDNDFKGDGLYLPAVFDVDTCSKSILMVSHELSRTGTPQVMFQAACILKSVGYFVVCACSKDGPLKEDYLKHRIPVVIHHVFAKFQGYPSDMVPTQISKKMSEFCHGFDLMIVGCIVMHNLITAFNFTDMKILWWIHDGYIGYNFCKHYMPPKIGSNIIVRCGGQYALEALKEFFPQYDASNLLYGVDDFADTEVNREDESEDLIFLFPASFEKRKNHPLLIEAVARLSEDILKGVRFIVIGKVIEKTYYRMVKKMAQKIPSIEIMEPISYTELMKLYSKVSCITLASMDDPMPVVLAEGMMMSKIILCSDGLGTARYIKDGVNGFVFSATNAIEFSKKIEFIIKNIGALNSVRVQARATYESVFSSKIFAENLKTTIFEIIGDSRETK